MNSPHQTYEVRCPIHGLVSLNDWEWNVISQPAFQRLRRIRQLAWTDYVYPGAMHTRFEHSLGVMHTATLIYDSILNTSGEILKSDLAYNEAGLRRDRQLVRFAALLHDIGHSPFSHASEELFPVNKQRKPYAHEDYSVAVVKLSLRDAIQNHPLNANYGFRAEDIAALIEGSASAKQAVFWRDLISGQMDADRMDYLLRDSYHAGVQYGRFDLHRLISTITAIPAADGHPPRLGITEGGVHAAEALVLARYFMFTQVYFHKTRVAYDVHLRGALKEMLPNGKFPAPTDRELSHFLNWDDWRVLGLIKQARAGSHADRILNRNHYRRIFYTPENSLPKDLEQLDTVTKALGKLRAAEESASKSWYKTGKPDIPVISDLNTRKITPLSRHSKVVANLKANNQIFVYVKPEDVSKSRDILKKVNTKWLS
jgi:HD superfamily phosphohydrolase